MHINENIEQNLVRAINAYLDINFFKESFTSILVVE